MDRRRGHSRPVACRADFADATLKDMCRKLPQTKARFLEVPGVGKAKMEQYGDRFTAEIKDFLESGAH
ncbi:HRDC domain-containing protein [Treponema endosymbiont of Eucomonympha sp.]|uniref:HRDC domain-containing protein n=1 Tax=Treponema endosymbiont of Eucomonympha sp. TaxID=1580831 RepID=UPI000A321FF0|nr:HRDC domain-containing protein [Treponema endosymbiont of Eucomonympha sp.]